MTFFYLLSFLLLSSFGLHRFFLAQKFKKNKDLKPKPLKKFLRLPRVTVQLPVYNERYVVERLIRSVCELDYPSDCLQIQVLDDSTDETRDITQKTAAKFRAMGFDISVLHRDDRRGFKAGALEEGLKYATGEYIAIFDADFIPPKNFLKHTIHFFTDKNIGVVQARWGHVNRDYSLLTKLLSILLDGHFLIEQTARFGDGLLFNFNGTAGVIRKTCLKDAGGWQHDTLTEDLDFSLRAQLKGWGFVYLKDCVVDAEVPININAFKIQQHRWTKGSIQTAKKLLPQILKSKRIRPIAKVEAAYHLLGGFSYPLLLILLILMLPFAYMWKDLGLDKVVLLNLIAITTGMVSVFRFYALAVKEAYGQKWLGEAKYLPLVIGLGTGIAINNTKAVLEALFNINSDFKRTPKFALTKKSDKTGPMSYLTKPTATTMIELMVGAFFLMFTLGAVLRGNHAWVPFLIILQAGFLYISILSLLHGIKK